jgi:hypothetical protein
LDLPGKRILAKGDDVSKWSVLIVVTVAIACWAQEDEVLFGGLSEGGAPAIEKEFDRVLREDLAGTPHVRLVDYESARNLARRIDLSQSPSLSRALVQRVEQYIPDSTIIVWGRVREYSFGVKRRALFGSAATGRLSLTVNIYSLRFGAYAFAGDIASHAEVPKGWIGFSPADQIIHMTATDRIALTTQLIDDAARKCADMIASAASSQAAKVYSIKAARKYVEPAVQDLFSQPSMEAAPVDTSAGNDTTVQDTAAEDTAAKPAADVKAEEAPAKTDSTAASPTK